MQVCIIVVSQMALNLDIDIYKMYQGLTIKREKVLSNGFKGKSGFLFQTIDSVVTNDSLQALVKQFYGLTIGYDEVSFTGQ